MKEFKPSSGLEKKIALDSRNPDLVVATYKERAPSPQFVKARHYLAKILGLVFSENIPQIHFSSTSPHAVKTERVKWDKDHARTSTIVKRMHNGYFPLHMLSLIPDVYKIASLEKKFQEDPKAQEFMDKTRKVLTFAPPQTLMDLGSHHNYTRDEQGNPIYLDSIEPWSYIGYKHSSLLLSINEKFLREEIEKLDAPQRKMAESALQRFLTLADEEQKRISNGSF